MTWGSSSLGMAHKRHDIAGAVLGGLLAAIGLFATTVAVGTIGDFEALRIIEAVLPTSRFLASTAIGTGVTVLALLLTLIGLGFNSVTPLPASLFTRARVIVTMSFLAIAIGTGLLVAVNVPIESMEQLTATYDVMYYALAVAISILGGVLMALGFMISATLIALMRLATRFGSPDDTPDLRQGDPLAGGESSR